MMNNMHRYVVDGNLFKHLDIDIDFSCDDQGTLDKGIIYILSDLSSLDEKILYVGQTNVNPKVRFKTHLKHLKFSHLYVMQLETNDRSVVNNAEQEQIKKLNPILQNFFTDFEKRNTCNEPVTYEHVVKWGNYEKKSRRPGRPRTKEESKTINVSIPIRILDTIENMFSENRSIKLNKTQLIIGLLEKYIEENN